MRGFRDQYRHGKRGHHEDGEGKRSRGKRGRHEEENDYSHLEGARAHRYCSRSEGACAVLMEKYLPGFEIKPGSSYQIAIGVNHKGHTLTLDFLVAPGVLFEYHEVRFWRSKKKTGDFKDYQEYRDYKKELLSLPKHLRKAFQEETKQKLAENYYQKRRGQLDANESLRDHELIVAISPGDFYEKVIKRFSEQYPDKGGLCGEFQKLLGQILLKDEEKGGRGRKRR